MTANELAVYLEDITDSEESPYRQAATMLRQQQAEIEKLGSELDRIVELYTDKAIENETLKPYKEKIEMMERAYDDHIKKSMGEVKDLIKKASKK